VVVDAKAQIKNRHANRGIFCKDFR